jgi:hypothetical protein
MWRFSRAFDVNYPGLSKLHSTVASGGVETFQDIQCTVIFRSIGIHFSVTTVVSNSLEGLHF